MRRLIRGAIDLLERRNILGASVLCIASARLTMFPSTIHLRHPNPSPPSTRVGNTYILFFITGNPGLIAYYRTFLSHLYALLSSTESSQASPGADQFQVFGRDLLGFEVEHADAASAASPPYGLQAQVEATEKALDTLVSDNTNASGNRPKVILIGHSVGAYILLEVLRRHREKLQKAAPQTAMTIIGGICLFPTVTHIMQSRSGKSAGVCKTPYLSYLSVFGKVARHAERSLCWHRAPQSKVLPFLTVSPLPPTLCSHC
ncbi:hypothetical protein BU16DRAFT_152206 [Lophium mytilinum]|uniref:Uncharacterized protein n=1 Tax=Lophium mytilinum TaxID=390894 RepID=A0A6A6QEH4_9PEZI|nr:hypothetical protein BU16DRAFT_152206 [Lophium mytilinum]